MSQTASAALQLVCCYRRLSKARSCFFRVEHQRLRRLRGAVRSLQRQRSVAKTAHSSQKQRCILQCRVQSTECCSALRLSNSLQIVDGWWSCTAELLLGTGAGDKRQQRTIWRCTEFRGTKPPRQLLGHLNVDLKKTTQKFLSELACNFPPAAIIYM